MTSAQEDAMPFVIGTLLYLIIYQSGGGVAHEDDSIYTDHWVSARLIMGLVTRVSMYCG